MLELVWPGKQLSAAKAVHGDISQPASWNPALAESALRGDFSAESGSAKKTHRLLAADNLDALRWMRSCKQKYDIIYIDPPYNTGSLLTYNDKSSQRGSFSSAAWLDQIYPRMILARELLHETGVLFVSIDDNEACHLMTLLREVFGHENHLGTIKWRRKRKPSFLDKHLSATLEYVLVFAKNSKLCPRLLGSMTEEMTRPVLNASNKAVERVIPAGLPAYCAPGEYAAGEYKNRSLTFTLLDPLIVADGAVLKDARVIGQFRIAQELWAVTGFVTKNLGLRRRIMESERKRRHAEDDGTHWPTNEDAQEELKQIFGERVFDFPKPVGLLREILAMVPQVDTTRPLECLDFYAGSGSFLIASLEQTRADGIERRVDLVQSREKTRSSGTHQFTDIAEICAHRVTVDSRRRGFSPNFSFLQL